MMAVVAATAPHNVAQGPHDAQVSPLRETRDTKERDLTILDLRPLLYLALFVFNIHRIAPS